MGFALFPRRQSRPARRARNRIGQLRQQQAEPDRRRRDPDARTRGRFLRGIESRQRVGCRSSIAQRRPGSGATGRENLRPVVHGLNAPVVSRRHRRGTGAASRLTSIAPAECLVRLVSGCCSSALAVSRLAISSNSPSGATSTEVLSSAPMRNHFATSADSAGQHALGHGPKNCINAPIAPASSVATPTSKSPSATYSSRPLRHFASARDRFAEPFMVLSSMQRGESSRRVEASPKGDNALHGSNLSPRSSGQR